MIPLTAVVWLADMLTANPSGEANPLALALLATPLLAFALKAAVGALVFAWAAIAGWYFLVRAMLIVGTVGVLTNVT